MNFVKIPNHLGQKMNELYILIAWVLLMFVFGMTYWFYTRSIKPSIEQLDEFSIDSNKDLDFKTKLMFDQASHQKLLDFDQLIFSIGPGCTFSVDFLNQFLKCEDKSNSNQKTIRSKFLTKANYFFKQKYQVEEAIFRARREDDNRVVIYRINPNLFTHHKSEKHET